MEIKKNRNNMSMAKKKKNTMITERTTKYKICSCGLKIRANGKGDDKIEAHENGWHHTHRGFIKR